MKTNNCLIKEEIAVQDKVSEYYDNRRYADAYAFKYHEWLTNKMFSFVHKEGLILDNGCGIGILSWIFPRKNVVGLDISLSMLGKARARNKNIVCANSEKLPFSTGSFDTVFCRSILHHLSDPYSAVEEMHRVLRPGGELVIMETNKSIFNTIPRKVLKHTEHFSDLHRNFDSKEILSIIRKKFQIESYSYFGFIAYPLIGFPDMIDIFRYFPFKKVMCCSLISLDDLISKIPVLRTQSFGLIVKSVKGR